MVNPVPRGLYAITSDALADDAGRLIAAVESSVAAGAAIVQLRAKRVAPSSREQLAGSLVEVCRARGVPLIVNDDVDLALRVGADGVHLGREDGRLVDARARLGTGRIIGITCNNDAHRAFEAAGQGADYIALGRFFPSRSKPDAPQAQPGLLETVRAATRTPICVIGGLRPDNIGPLRDAGADLFAAIDAIFGDADVAAATRRFVRALEAGPAGGPT